MKKLYHVLFIGSVIMSQAPKSFAQNSPCIQSPGQTICSPGTQKDLNGQGMVSINGTHITGQTKIHGLLTATQAQLNHLQVHGTSHLNATTVQGACELTGDLTALDSKFAAPIKLSGNHAEFNHCQVHSIQVNSSHIPTLILHEGSQVRGNIIFTGTAGVVKIDPSSSLLGKVQNGKVESVKNSPNN